MLLYLLNKAKRHLEESPALPAGNEVDRAQMELAIAWQHFNHAEPAFVDAAIYRLNAAEQAYSTLLKEQKISFRERSHHLEIVQ